METLNTVHMGQIYYIDHVLGTDLGRLRDLGFVADRAVSLISINGENAIVKIENARIALTVTLLQQIFVQKEHAHDHLIGLSNLNVGQTGIVRSITSTGELKRRLMDMGITRGTSIYVRKLAPLGDPMELHLRGYALSLRKSDAENIKVILEK